MKFNFFWSAIFFVLAVWVMSCSQVSIHPSPAKKAPPYAVNGKVFYPLGKVEGYVERGIASWYGEEFQGKRTSNGEIYNMYEKTAAHRIIPFGTYVQVTNLTNGKKTTVRINDRGPFIKGRIIDLSYAGAREIGLIGPGTAPVELKVVGSSGSAPLCWTGNFVIQVGAFEDLKNANGLKAKLSHHYGHVYITTFNSRGKFFYRVRIGKYNNFQETMQIQKELESRGYRDTFVVAE